MVSYRQSVYSTFDLETTAPNFTWSCTRFGSNSVVAQMSLRLLLFLWDFSAIICRARVSAQGMQTTAYSQRREDQQHPLECESWGEGCWFWTVQAFQQWCPYPCIYSSGGYTGICRSRVCTHFFIFVLNSIFDRAFCKRYSENTMLSVFSGIIPPRSSARRATCIALELSSWRWLQDNLPYCPPRRMLTLSNGSGRGFREETSRV